ncbi:hypothetical protein MLD52_17370 [Puniceicoccaceae bacterium K14]|nr:hypothetical protein [Puniceicoccaceae bacterium K14]
MCRSLLIAAFGFVTASGYASDDLAQETEPPFERLISMLRSSDAVIPPSVEGYPVANVYNREGVVPPQCYTKTEGHFNACYVCHQSPIEDRENVMNDIGLQIAYSFSDLGMTNHWKNLFEDRTERVAQIGDEEIKEYVNEDNYSELAPRLEEAGFEGWIPDLKDLQLGAEAFGDEGFAKDGSMWVAFNYKPMPSTFWPTNGSTDDVMIRLPEIYRSDKDGNVSLDVYKANLSILEAAIKGFSEIESLPIDEVKVGFDLDGDGVMGVAHRVERRDTYLGGAAGYKVYAHLYPEGTEFLHTVRYLAVDEEGQVGISRRMKEVRYMRKWRAYAKPIYARQYQLEAFEKEAGHLPGYQDIGDYGLDNGNGWAIHGFIENGEGRLRSSTFEENFFCMGCHNSIGSTIDKTFSFGRKVDGAKGWSYINLKGMPDAPNIGEVVGEFETYLERVGGGSEFRNNEEMRQRWFKADGSLDREKVRAAEDLNELIVPSVARALLLNKAYKTIVEDQDFIYGRDATVTPPANVYDKVDNETTPTLPGGRVFQWNILLDWDGKQASTD